MENSFRLVFMGTPEFASHSLNNLVEAGCQIVAVVTAPDKPAGRGQKLSASDVKTTAFRLGLPILQPEKLKDPDFIRQLNDLKPDLFVVVAFRMLPEAVWSIPRYGTINLHASLLPAYRGAAPINHALINGETITGVTTFFIEKEIDTGNIIFQEQVKILPDDDAETLHDRLKMTGAGLLVKTVKSIQTNDYPKIAQSLLIRNSLPLPTAPKIFKDDCKIDWAQSVQKLYNLIRGLSPVPTAWTVLRKNDSGEELPLKIYKAEAEFAPDISKPPGTIETNRTDWLRITCNDGYLSIKELQLAGKKRMPVRDFLNGFPIDNYAICH